MSDETEPQPDVKPQPPTSPLIEPAVVGRLSRDIATDALSTEKMAEPHPSDWPVVPDELVAFLESQNLDELIAAVVARPTLYWHPTVARQVLHLHRVAFDLEHEDDVELAQAAREVLERLITAHAERMVRGRRLGWKDQPKKSGPKDAIPNPYPSEIPGSETIGPAQLFATWERVRDVLNSEAITWTKGKGEADDAYRLRVTKTVQARLRCLPIEWSDRWGPEGAPSVSAEDSPYDAIPLSTYDSAIDWNTDFAQAVNDALDPDSSFDLKDGMPAALAYSILGHLLSDATRRVPGGKVRDKITRYRAKLGKKAPPVE